MIPIIAIVRSGTKFGFEYVTKMRNMLARHVRREHDLICFTDQAERCHGVNFIDITKVGLTGWWAKMLLFEPQWRGARRVVFLDLDTVIINDITALLDIPGEFAICENFTRLAGNTAYPCRYNSSVMVIGPGQASFVWRDFERNRDELIAQHEPYGDQRVIEALYPDALLLQSLLPKDFFINYRHITMHRPKRAAIVNFAGRSKPHLCEIPWVREEWA